MTFATKSSPSGEVVRRQSRKGFTLIELLLVIGIIALLMSLLLPMATRSWGRAIRLRTASDLSAIATALEAYKSDFYYYPPVTIANSGAATLGKALIGPADAARYYTGSAGAEVAVGALQNQNDIVSFDATKTYQAGDVVRSGNGPSFTQFVRGYQSTGNPRWNIFVSLRNDNLGHAPSGVTTASTPDYWWVPFLPFDGADGLGIRPRLNAITETSGSEEVLPRAAAGRVYGPYLNADRFRTRGPVILDRWGSPILYSPVSRSGDPSNAYVVATGNPRLPSQPLPVVNPMDNFASFHNPQATPAEQRGIAIARQQIMMGDYNVDGVWVSPEPEPATKSLPFVLWSAGPDGVFGPRGANASTSGTYSLSNQDFYAGDNTHAAENAATAAAVDDVTNFR